MDRHVAAPFLLIAALLGAAASGCARVGLAGRFLAMTTASLFRGIRPAPRHAERPVRTDAHLAVTWIGHSTVLIQIDDKILLTDPVFTDTVGQVSRRLVAPGLEAERVPPLDAVLVSHMHFDHLSLGSLEMIEDKARVVLVPRGGVVYLPGFSFPSYEVGWWDTWERDGLRVTAVPVRHIGWRYALDASWMTTSYTGWIIEHHGVTVYVGGDTAYTDAFVQTRKRFPHIDLALLPIAPIHPRDFMCRVHLDPEGAVQAFFDLGAARIMPVHFDTFENSLDAPGEARKTFGDVVARRKVPPDRVALLEIGEQRVLVSR